MSQTFHRPASGDTRKVPDVLADQYDANPAWERVSASDEPGNDAESGGDTLRGAALDDALRAAELSTSGTADEKRARLAEHTKENS